MAPSKTSVDMLGFVEPRKPGFRARCLDAGKCFNGPTRATRSAAEKDLEEARLTGTRESMTKYLDELRRAGKVPLGGTEEVSDLEADRVEPSPDSAMMDVCTDDSPSTETLTPRSSVDSDNESVSASSSNVLGQEPPPARSSAAQDVWDQRDEEPAWSPNGTDAGSGAAGRYFAAPQASFLATCPLPLGISSWDYPLSREEKKSLVLMFDREERHEAAEQDHGRQIKHLEDKLQARDCELKRKASELAGSAERVKELEQVVEYQSEHIRSLEAKLKLLKQLERSTAQMKRIRLH